MYSLLLTFIFFCYVDWGSPFTGVKDIYHVLYSSNLHNAISHLKDQQCFQAAYMY